MIYDEKSVKQQYVDDKNLAVRLNLHKKHSTNKQGFTAWLWEQYDFPENCKILELGCGNGFHWESGINNLPSGCSVVLTDFSQGMVDVVKHKYAEDKRFSFMQMDIQEIAFPDETFDIVIANYMLYHVPDINKALSEARRVLKSKGVFYSATNGNGGMFPFLNKAFKHFNSDSKAFTHEVSFSLQNGYEILYRHFTNVARIDYNDSLSITETQDLIEWIKSTAYIDQDISGMFDYFENIRVTDGAINIPKETGLFISSK